ncbi:MAG: hypothetical protein WB821_06410, partial [Burkholderiaceae bacterium]
MATHTIRIIKGGRTLSRKQVTEGLGRDAVVIQAQPDVTYLLSDMLENTGPSKIAAKRVGKSLHIAIGKGNPDAPDLIIEGYFDYPPAPIAGNLAEGGQAVYDLTSVTAPASATSAASSATPTTGVPGTGASAPVAQASLASEGMDTTMWALVGLGGALALAGSGGGGGGSGGGAEAATNTA